MNRNTMLCVDVKTFLQNDPILSPGKGYKGVLMQDGEEHLRFEETVERKLAMKRNPHVYDGNHITVTRWDDGTYHPNFRPVKIGAGFNIDSYAIGVCNELRQALHGLVEEE